MDAVNAVGLLAALLTTTAFVPQVVRTVRTGDTRAISMWMYLLFCAGVALWAAYGIMLGAWPVILANCATLALAAIVLWHKLREPPPSRTGGREETAPPGCAPRT